MLHLFYVLQRKSLYFERKKMKISVINYGDKRVQQSFKSLSGLLNFVK